MIRKCQLPALKTDVMNSIHHLLNCKSSPRVLGYPVTLTHTWYNFRICFSLFCEIPVIFCLKKNGKSLLIPPPKKKKKKDGFGGRGGGVQKSIVLLRKFPLSQTNLIGLYLGYFWSPREFIWHTMVLSRKKMTFEKTIT